MKDHSQPGNSVVIVSIDWKAMAIKDWMLCAKDAGDPNWMVTRDIASENSPEGLNMVYRNTVLIGVHYCLPTCLGCGNIRCRGKYITYRQREQLEEDFYQAVNPFCQPPPGELQHEPSHSALLPPPKLPIPQYLPNHHARNSNTMVYAIALLTHPGYGDYRDT
jgi:hypothetical protein